MKSSKMRYLSEISSVRQLREARRELEIREWFARQRLIDDALDTFTLRNLLSMVAPRGSLIDRVIGGVGTGLSAVSSLFGGRSKRSVARPAAHVARPAASVAHAAPKPKAKAKPKTKAAPKVAKAVKAPKTPRVPRVPKASKPKHTPEIEVEVALEP